MLHLICLAFGFFCQPGAAPGQEDFRQRQQAARPDLPAIVGRASVIDGDTIEIGGRRIRLQGIDAPESGQSCEDETGKSWRCGQAAARALDAMVGGRTTTCRQDPRDPADRYGRALALCEAGGVAVELEMLRQGHAVAYRRYLDYRRGRERPHKAAFLAAEQEAREGRRGIWRGRFTPPDEWRAERRGGL